MIKVLHLVEQNYPENSGGVERYLYFLIKQAVANSPELNYQKIKFIQKSAKSLGIYQPYGISPQTIGYPFAVEQRLNKFIKINLIDVIHVHHPAPFGLNLLSKLAKKHPLILHWHDYFLLCQKTQLLNHQNQICSGPSVTKCTLCLQKKSSFIKKILVPFSVQWRIINAYKLMEASAAIVLPQSNLYQKVPKIFRAKCVVIPYQSEPQWELDLNLIKNQKLATNLKTNSWCVLGGPSSHKGIFDLIDELKIINFTGELNIFGEGWSQNINLPPFVKIRGRLLSKKQLEACSHWIIPSIWEETGPLVAIEAYKMGLNIWARKGSITSDMSDIYNISFFKHARDIDDKTKRKRTTKTIPTWKSILRSYEVLYTKFT